MSRITLPNGKQYATDKHGYIQAQVDVYVADLIDNDLEGVLDLMSEGAVDSPLLMDVSFTAIEVINDGLIRFIVTGDPSNIIEDEA